MKLLILGIILLTSCSSKKETYDMLCDNITIGNGLKAYSRCYNSEVVCYMWGDKFSCVSSRREML